MNTTKHVEVNRRRTLVAAGVAFILMLAYAVVPIRPEGTVATQPQADNEPRAHRGNLVSRKVGTAGPLAEPGAAESQQKIDLPNAKPTDHGLMLALDDVLFMSGRADLKPGALGNLNKLVNFLGKYLDRTVVIHGYTDSLGTGEYNQRLSERRANSVKAYLASQGIDSARLSASGMGQSAPVAGNDSGAGRQQNRRVEVIISNPPARLPPRARTAKMIALITLLESVSGTLERPQL